MKKKKTLWSILLIIALLVIIAATIYIVSHFFSGGNSSEYIKENTTSASETQARDSLEQQFAENHDIDWDKLHKDNEDIYAWIYVPNTDVDYPIVQSMEGDDSFYLDHNLKKEYEFAGSIYSEFQNKKNFSDPVTVLYGHNMLNGSMFATLHKFEDESFFKKNKYMYVYTPNHKLTYRIYSAYVYDDRHILNAFDFSKWKVLKKYQKYTLNPDSLNKNTRKVQLGKNSKILTLSTCTNGAENTRYLVQGVLTNDEQTR